LLNIPVCRNLASSLTSQRYRIPKLVVRYELGWRIEPDG
jgi:hypothetical protein